MVIAGEVEVEPGGSLVERPVTRGDAAESEFGISPDRFQSLIYRYPRATAFGEYFATGVAAASTGTIAEKLGTFRLGTNIGHFCKSAIAALSTVKEDLLRCMLKCAIEHSETSVSIGKPGDPFQRGKPWLFIVES